MKKEVKKFAKLYVILLIEAFSPIRNILWLSFIFPLHIVLNKFLTVESLNDVFVHFL